MAIVTHLWAILGEKENDVNYLGNLGWRTIMSTISLRLIQMLLIIQQKLVILDFIQ